VQSLESPQCLARVGVFHNPADTGTSRHTLRRELKLESVFAGNGRNHLAEQHEAALLRASQTELHAAAPPRYRQATPGDTAILLRPPIEPETRRGSEKVGIREKALFLWA
jgi:hypothetical protein